MSSNFKSNLYFLHIYTNILALLKLINGIKMSYYKWSELTDSWSETSEYWIIDKIIGPIGAGGGPDEWFGNFQKLTKDEKKKVIRIIIYRNKIKFQQSKEIKEDEYTVTIDDVKNLVEDFLEQKKQVKIKITDVSMNDDESTWG